MGMAMGGGKGGPMGEMNITPMIDVLLVLIIIFMLVSQEVRSHGLEALVPQPASHAESATPTERTVVVQIFADAGGKPAVRINQQPVAWEQLRARLFQIYTVRAERVLFIQADSSLDFETVAEVIDLAHSDFPDMKIGLITDQLMAKL